MKDKRFLENNTESDIITDNADNPSVMVYIERFYLDEVIDGASHILHPAFIVDGREIDGIYISKYQNIVTEGRAYSLYGKDPATHIGFDTANAVCKAKGEGFHLMTAMEWGAIALWCQKNGWLPFGNNDMGKDFREDKAVAEISYLNEEKKICRTATGSGPVEWSHNRKTDGIYDLNANVWEWVGGIRLVFGELQVLPFNNAASHKYSQDALSNDWRVIDGTNGEYLIPDGKGTTKNSIKLDYIDGKWTYIAGTLSGAENSIRFCDFKDITADESVCKKVVEMLYSMSLLPVCDAYFDKGVSLFANNSFSECIPFRGGRWGQGENSGIFKTCLDDPRTLSGDAIGFRSAYYKP